MTSGSVCRRKPSSSVITSSGTRIAYLPAASRITDTSAVVQCGVLAMAGVVARVLPGRVSLDALRPMLRSPRMTREATVMLCVKLQSSQHDITLEYVAVETRKRGCGATLRRGVGATVAPGVWLLTVSRPCALAFASMNVIRQDGGTRLAMNRIQVGHH